MYKMKVETNINVGTMYKRFRAHMGCFLWAHMGSGVGLIFFLSPSHPQFEGFLPSFHGRIVKGELVLTDYSSTFFVSCVRDHVKVRSPHLKLPLPVDDGGEWSAHQERPLGVTLSSERESEDKNTLKYKKNQILSSESI